jgi:ABC-2 type transport system permease protein
LNSAAHRIWLIAKRDYLQTVTSKAYLFGLVFLPLIFGGVFLALSLVNRGNAKDQRIVVIDHTGVSAQAVIQACEEANNAARLSPGGLRVMPRFRFEEAAADSGPDSGLDSGATNTEDRDAGRERQLLALSERVRRGELFLVLEIGAGDEPVRYYTDAAFDQTLVWLPAAVNDGLRRVRLTQAGAQLGWDAARAADLLREVPVESMNLVARDPATGNIAAGRKKNPLESAVVPTFLVVLMIMVVIIGSAPHLSAVAEDKMQRVFEMLLGSASAFELMLGKVLAALGSSLTSSTFYIIGGLLALAGMALFGLAPLHLLPWFFVYLAADVTMISALAVALGAACATPQDAQHLVSVLFAPIFIPMFLLTPVMQQPDGWLATVMSLLPPFTPVLMLLRQALPGGVPWWQPWLGLLGVAVWASVVVWAAARIFRIGILSQGKAPKLAELAAWVLQG